MYWRVLYNEQTLQIEHFVSNSHEMPTCAVFGEYDETTLACKGVIDPDFEITRDKKVVLYEGGIVDTIDSPNPVQPPELETEPPRSTHISTLEAIDPSKARPARIKRVWEDQDYFYDCFATETVKDEYVAGKIAVGDYVLVHFDDIGEQIVTAKVYKSWNEGS